MARIGDSGTTCTSINPWPVWTVSAVTNTSTTVNYIWQTWAGERVIATTAATTGVWGQWVAGVPVEVHFHEPVYTNTDRERQQERDREQFKESQDAEAKARELLVKCMTPHQRRTFNREGHFDVITSKRRRYRINASSVRFITKRGSHAVSFCIHPPDYRIPGYDSALAKKLMLETDEEQFLRIANPTKLYGITDKEADEIMREAARLKANRQAVTA